MKSRQPARSQRSGLEGSTDRTGNGATTGTAFMARIMVFPLERPVYAFVPFFCRFIPVFLVPKRLFDRVGSLFNYAHGR
jgi:hypothetical protein